MEKEAAMTEENDSAGIWHTHSEDQGFDADSIILLEENTGIQDWMVPAAFSTIFCFFPTGIVAIYSALKAKKSKVKKDYKGWNKYNGQARFFVFLTLLVGMFVYGVIIGAVKSISNNQGDT